VFQYTGSSFLKTLNVKFLSNSINVSGILTITSPIVLTYQSSMTNVWTATLSNVWEQILQDYVSFYVPIKTIVRIIVLYIACIWRLYYKQSFTTNMSVSKLICFSKKLNAYYFHNKHFQHWIGQKALILMCAYEDFHNWLCIIFVWNF